MSLESETRNNVRRIVDWGRNTCPNCEKIGSAKELSEQLQSLVEVLEQEQIDIALMWLRAAVKKLEGKIDE